MTPHRRIAVVASHPIQYQAPWFRALAERTQLTVFFCHAQDRSGQQAAGYSDAFEWDIPLLDGYHSVWLRNVSRNPGVFAFSGCDTPEVRERLAAGGFDACIVSGWYLKSYLQAIIACRRLRIPVVLRGDSQLTTSRSVAKRMMKAFAYPILLNAVDGHLYVGEANRDYLRHYGVPSERLFFVPHVVDDVWFGAQAEAALKSGTVARLRREFAATDDTVVVLFVGRLVASKRPVDFVEAVARASRSRRMLGVIAGSGPLEADVRARIAALNAPVQMAGFVNQSALPAMYRSAEILVLPSDASETWGLVVNEAMACGTPAVVSNAVGCARDLIDASTGARYPVGDVDALASAIAAVAAKCDAAPDQIQRALADKVRTYSAAAATDRTLAAIEHIQAGRRKPVPRASDVRRSPVDSRHA